LDRNTKIGDDFLIWRFLQTIDLVISFHLDVSVNNEDVLDLQILHVLLQGLGLVFRDSLVKVEVQLPPSVSGENSVGVGVGLARSGLVGQVEVPGGGLVGGVHVEGHQDLVVLPTIRPHAGEITCPNFFAESKIHGGTIHVEIRSSDVVDVWVKIHSFVQNNIQCLQRILGNLAAPTARSPFQDILRDLDAADHLDVLYLDHDVPALLLKPYSNLHVFDLLGFVDLGAEELLVSIEDPGGVITAWNWMDLLPSLDDIVVELLVGPSIISFTIPRRTDCDTVLVDDALWELQPDSEVVGLKLAGSSSLRGSWELSVES